MDTTAFEAGGDDTVTLADVHASLPWPIQVIVHHVVLALAGLGCLVTFLCMCAWVSFFWLSVNFLRLFARLLGLIYETPVTLGGEARSAGEVTSSAQKERQHESKEMIEEATGPTSDVVASSTDFDGTSSENVSKQIPDSTAQIEHENGVEMDGCALDKQDFTHDQQFERPRELERYSAKGETFQPNEDKVEAEQHMTAGAKTDAAFQAWKEDHCVRSNRDWGSTGELNQANLAKSADSEPDRRAQEKAERQTAWLKSFKDAASTIRRNTAAQVRAMGVARQSAPLWLGHDTAQVSTQSVGVGGKYSADQLAEARSFSREATRGNPNGSRRRGAHKASNLSNSNISTVPARASTCSPDASLSTTKRYCGQCKQVKSAIHFQRVGPPPSQAQQTLLATTCAECRGLEVDLLRKTVRLKGQTPSRKPFTADPSFVPPHLRKKAEAQALKKRATKEASDTRTNETAAPEKVPTQHKLDAGDGNLSLLTRLMVGQPNVADSDVNQHAAALDVRSQVDPSPQRSSAEPGWAAFSTRFAASSKAQLPSNRLGELELSQPCQPSERPVADHKPAAKSALHRDTQFISHPNARVMTIEELKSFNPAATCTELLDVNWNEPSAGKAKSLKDQRKAVGQCRSCKRWTLADALDDNLLCRCCASVDLNSIRNWNSIMAWGEPQHLSADTLRRLRNNSTRSSKVETPSDGKLRSGLGDEVFKSWWTTLPSTEQLHDVQEAQNRKSQSSDATQSPHDEKQTASGNDNESGALAADAEMVLGGSASVQNTVPMSPKKLSQSNEQRQAIFKQIQDLAAKKAARSLESEPPNTSTISSELPVQPTVFFPKPEKSTTHLHPDLVGLDFTPPPEALKPSAKPKSFSLAPQATPFFAPSSRSSSLQAPVQKPSASPTWQPIPMSSCPPSMTTNLGASRHSFSGNACQPAALMPQQISFPPFAGDQPDSYLPFEQAGFQDISIHPYSHSDMELPDPRFMTYDHSVLYQGPPSAPVQPLVPFDPTATPFLQSGLQRPSPALASGAKQQKRRLTASKAIPIVKPQWLAEHANYPFLPMSNQRNASMPIQAPPGLSDGVKASQKAFDSLLSNDSIAGYSAWIPPFDGDPAQQQSANHASESENILSLDSSEQPVHHQEPKEDKSPDGDQPPTEAAPNASSTAPASEVSSAMQKKKRRVARKALNDAWHKREQVRARVSGTFTLDGIRALEETTQIYNQCRQLLAGNMATKQLSEEDETIYPFFAKRDLSKPKVRPESIEQSFPDEDDINGMQTDHPIKSKKATSSKVSFPTNVDELHQLALNAHSLYVDAYDRFHRPPPEGRSKLKARRETAEKRIQRATKYYDQKYEELKAACGGKLPSEWEDELWKYDDESEKARRDTVMP